MTRKRLGAIDRDSISELRGAAEKAAQDRRGVIAGKAPPIAQVAGSAAKSIEDEMVRLRQDNASLQAAANNWQEATSGGLIVKLVPLADIDIHSIARDRRTIDREGEPWAELKASLRARGQQVPIEIGGRSATHGKFRLISGYRRVNALMELYEETGEERFATVKALVSRARDKLNATIAMIDENEIRQDISFYERGRICCIAADQGICDSVDDAIQVLFASSSRNRRYKIRNFTLIHTMLGTYLDFPEHIGERLGARLAQALKDGKVDDLIRVLSDRETKFTDPAEELGLLEDFVAGKGSFAEEKPAVPELKAGWQGEGRVKATAVVRNGKMTVKLDGVQIEDREELEWVLARIGAVFSA